MSISPCNNFNKVVCLLLLVISTFLLNSCKNNKKLIKVDPAFSKFIEGYTSGVISKKSTIRIQLATEATISHGVNVIIKDNIFHFSPSIEGTAYWIDNRTIEFKPSADLEVNKLYEANFDLAKIIKVPDAFKEFIFNFKTIKPAFEIEEDGLRSTSKDLMTLKENIITADVELSAKVEKLLTANQDEKVLSIKWQHNEANKTHVFFIENIARKKTESVLKLYFDGAALNIHKTDFKTVVIPAIGDFKVMHVKVVQDEEQYISVLFSDMLAVGQSLNGLVTFGNEENLSYSIQGSEVKVYGPKRFNGSYNINVHTGIENLWGSKLPGEYSGNVFFENRLPNVKIHGKGVILPNSAGKIVLPFDATNLKAVDVSIIKIYENSIPQFLQENKLDGNSNLRKVGRPMALASIKLDDDKSLNLHKRNRFSLDLNKYISSEPGALYRVTIGFKPEYSLYACDSAIKKDHTSMSGEGTEADNSDINSFVDDDAHFWHMYDDNYEFGYDWEQKDNPCVGSYYNRDRFENRNILSSNIGLTAKLGSDNKLFVAVNNLISTNVMPDVELQVLDFQQQVLAKGTTNSEGIALIVLKRKPYLVIAKKGNEKGYLLIDDGSVLPLSRFKVGGDEVKNGIKGFIFGERGVWRPGDSLFLSCIIEDKDNKLPKDHPIEMDLISPKNQLYNRIVKTNAEDGFNIFRTVTDASAPTGNWICRVKVGGASFDKRIKIETVMPNRLKINLNFYGMEALGKNSATNVTLSAKWLFGANAQNLKARVDAELYKTRTAFEKFDGYIFDNPISAFKSQSTVIFDGSLNKEGEAIINPSFESGSDAPGVLLSNLMIKVFEPGGNFSIDNISMKYNPYSSYVGIHMPPADKTFGYLLNNKVQSFNIVDVSTNGALISGTTQVDVEIYKIRWRWWWDNSGDEMSNFSQDRYNTLWKKETILLNNGKGVYNLPFNSTQNGRFLMIVKDTRSGHKTGNVFYVEDNDWQSHGDNTDVTAASMLSFTSSKPKYNVGETIKVTIPTSQGGKALISIETGNKILKTYWVDTKKGETNFSFNAEKQMSPNIFVNVSLIQAHGQTNNDLPIRMYGVIPVEVEDKNSILHPEITMRDVISPETVSTIHVSERNGKDMTYVIAIVDEGLLDLTRFKTPNPHDAFYAKEALGVKSWDIYDYVIGAWSGELERILTIGGDGAAELSSKTRKANRFKPVVKFLGPFKSNGNSKSHQFTLPVYSGSVRVMLIAAQNGAYGITDKSVKVTAPLMMLPTVPRVLGPGEEFTIPVSIFMDDKKYQSPSLIFKANDFFESVKVNNAVNFSNGEGIASVVLKVKEKTGISKIRLEASSGPLRAVYQAEIDVRNANTPLTQVSEYTLQPNQRINTNVTLIGNVRDSKATLEVSSMPPLNLQKRLSFLIEYPHGCIEQTTSAVYPQLVLDQLIDLDNQRKLQIDINVKAGIRKIQNFQTSNGGFSYWPGGNIPDEWGSNYAGNFLIEASNKGYIVPSQLLQQWKSYERATALKWNVTAAPQVGSDLTQAYRLYLLALSKSPEIGAMNRLKEYKFLSTEAKWRLAAAYYLSGQQDMSGRLIAGLPVLFTPKTYAGMTYGSDVRDDAMVLETLTIMNRKEQATQLVRAVTSKLMTDKWYSTQTTAFSLMAVAKYCGINKNGSKISVEARINNLPLQISSEKVLSQTSLEWKNGSAEMQVKNKGDNVLYVRVINQGQPLSNQIIPVINNPNILQVNATYMTTEGQPIDVTKLQQGKDFVAKVVVRNPGGRGTYQQMALGEIFPSGWEILNTRLYNSEGAFKSSPSEYMDIRDDRVYYYFNLLPRQSLTYYVQLTTSYPGRYFWPGVYCEAMYDNTISGGSTGKWIEVTQ